MKETFGITDLLKLLASNSSKENVFEVYAHEQYKLKEAIYLLNLLTWNSYKEKRVLDLHAIAIANEQAKSNRLKLRVNKDKETDGHRH